MEYEIENQQLKDSIFELEHSVLNSNELIQETKKTYERERLQLEEK